MFKTTATFCEVEVAVGCWVLSLSTNYRDLSAIVSSAAPNVPVSTHLQNSGYWGRRQVAKNGLIEVFSVLVEICPPLYISKQHGKFSTPPVLYKLIHEFISFS